MSVNQFLVSCPKGLEQLLEVELRELGVPNLRLATNGVYCQMTLPEAYRVCLWSRLANRVLLEVGSFPVKGADDLYEAARQVSWTERLRPGGTLLVDFRGQSEQIKHSHFGALKIKDAIVDQFRDQGLERPLIDKEWPELRVQAFLRRDRLTLYLDLAGRSLHQRGYRAEGAKAPLKENLAAAILLRAGWQQMAAAGAPLVDPMCGSGTLLIEAAWIAADTAPGLLDHYFSFQRWPGFQVADWQPLLQEARARQEAGRAALKSSLHGYDADLNAVKAAQMNIEQADLVGVIHVERRALADFRLPSTWQEPGLLIANPPYGERLSDEITVQPLYQALGEVLRHHCRDWNGAIFTGNPKLGKYLGVRSHHQYAFFNGAIPCKLLLFKVNDETIFRELQGQPEQPRAAVAGDKSAPVVLGESVRMFANRLAKNMKKLDRWAAREGIECYRIYDADLPEYAVAIDRYRDWLHVQEYAPPKSVDPVKAQQRLQDLVLCLPEVTGVPAHQIVLKERRQQKGTSQYQKLDQSRHELEVTEHGCRLYVNLRDYLDTGLFLDHRPMRRWMQANAKGKRVLNLFCYTGAVTVHAARGSARRTLSVDLSKTYINWARRNLTLNGFSEAQHEFVQADCMQWLKEARERFDIIFLDPPTFSNSKRTDNVLDVQRDHEVLVDDAMRLLERGGVLIFSNNYRRFQMSPALEQRYEVTEISRETLDPDFERNPKIHRCWRIRWRS